MLFNLKRHGKWIYKWTNHHTFPLHPSIQYNSDQHQWHTLNKKWADLFRNHPELDTGPPGMFHLQSHYSCKPVCWISWFHSNNTESEPRPARSIEMVFWGSVEGVGEKGSNGLVYHLHIKYISASWLNVCSCWRYPHK